VCADGRRGVRSHLRQVRAGTDQSEGVSLTAQCDLFAGLDVLEGEYIECQGVIVEAPQRVWPARMIDPLHSVSILYSVLTLQPRSKTYCNLRSDG
jgi:hypothetical protein